MAGIEKNEFSIFLDSGIHRLPNSNAVFIDPVRILNRIYSQLRVCLLAYYSRFFYSKFDGQPSENENDDSQKSKVFANDRKRKRNQKKKNKQHYALNEKELLADQRHQEISALLVKAHGDLLGAKELLDEMMCEIVKQRDGSLALI